MATLKKKSKNQSFILTVCLMIALIVAIMIPTTIAWFTSQSVGQESISIDFGKVNVGINAPSGLKQNGVLISDAAEKKFTNILPGDNIGVQIEIFNEGSVSIYAIPRINVDFYYITNPEEGTRVKITQLIASYLSINQTGTQEVLELSKSMVEGNGINYEATISIDTSLPNEISDANGVYVLNGSKNNVVIEFNIEVAAIQKDNLTKENAIVELNKIITPATANNTYENVSLTSPFVNGVSNGGTITVNNKTVEAIKVIDLSADGAPNSTAALLLEENDDNLKLVVAPITNQVQTLAAGTTEVWAKQTDYIKTFLQSKPTGSEKTYGEYVRTFEIADGITHVGEKLSRYMPNLETIIVGKDVVYIGNYSLKYPTNLNSLVFKAATTQPTIETNTGVFNIDGVKELIIPANLEFMGVSPFGNLSQIEKFVVESGNPTYYVDGNFIIDRANKRTLVGCATSVIPTDGSVTKIGERTFQGFSAIDTIEIPSTITTIEDAAFTQSSIKKIVIPNNVKVCMWAFQNCFQLKSVVLGSGATDHAGIAGVGTQAFDNCPALTTFENHTNFAKVNDSVFRDTPKLTDIYLGTNVTSIGSEAFLRSGIESATVGDNITAIGNFAFDQCKNLTYFNFGTKLQTIGERAFRLTKLETVELPNTLKTITSAAFHNCTNLKTLIVKDGVTSMGASAFADCTTLETVSIDSNISALAFHNCSNIKNLTIGNNVATMSTDAFRVGGWVSYDIYYRHLTNLENLTINSNSALGTYACYYLTNLSQVTFGDNVTEIPDGAFQDCSSLKIVNFSSNLTSIGANAFSKCSKLDEIVIITTSALTIKSHAFTDCEKATKIVIKAASESSIADSAMQRCYAAQYILLDLGDGSTIGTFAFQLAGDKNGVNLAPFYVNRASSAETTEWGTESWPFNASSTSAGKKLHTVYYAGQWSYNANGEPVAN